MHVHSQTVYLKLIYTQVNKGDVTWLNVLQHVVTKCPDVPAQVWLLTCVVALGLTHLSVSAAAAHVRVLSEFLSLRPLPGSWKQLRRDRSVQVSQTHLVRLGCEGHTSYLSLLFFSVCLQL